jgi:membrane fusion protein (multidrug efflux system)
MSSLGCFKHGASAALLALIIAGCGDQAATKPASGNAPPPEVAVITVAPQRLSLTTELPGRLEAARTAQVRARVPGIVLQRVFREGSEVKAGDVLFRIDPSPFQANVNSVEATLAKAQANLAQANLKAKRYAPLVETNAISRQEYDDVLTAQKQAEADIAAAKAALQTARINLGHATVTAPISGRIGRAQVTEGALVGQNEATPLATIQQLDPIYVNLTQSSADVLRLRRALASGKLQKVGRDGAKVTLLMEDGQPYPHPGKLLFSDMTVDESSGAVTLRASFPNPDKFLMPGMFVRARIEQAISENAITVPQQAVLRTADSATVMLVDADNKVIVKPVQANTSQGNSWIVSEGLQAGERVIVEGFQKVKPGATVRPVPWQGAAAKSSAAKPAAANGRFQ